MNRKLPILISVPHGSLRIPREVKEYCRLSHEDIIRDSDEGSPEIYNLRKVSECFISADIARAIVDLNRNHQDFSDDGVIKSVTVQGIPVYTETLPCEVIQVLLAKYYYPYHMELSRMSSTGLVKLGIDCHTMLAIAPHTPGSSSVERPEICISDLEGKTLPATWMEALAKCLEKSFNIHVSVNDPFKGGYIIQKHYSELPWVQLEFSRASFYTNLQKHNRLVDALKDFVNIIDT